MKEKNIAIDACKADHQKKESEWMRRGLTPKAVRPSLVPVTTTTTTTSITTTTTTTTTTAASTTTTLC